VDVKPSKAWYWVAGAVFVAGIAVAVALFVTTLLGVIDDLERFDAPGSQSVTLEEDDKRAIYFEPGVSGTCRVSPPVKLTEDSGSSIDLGDDSFESVLAFEAPRAGSYEVSCETARPSRAAVGPTLASVGFVGSILLSVAAARFALFVAPAIAIVVAIMRHQRKKRAAPGTASPPPGSP